MTPAYRLRPFTPEDYPDFVTLGNLVFGDDVPMNEARLRWLDETRDQTRPRGRIFAVDKGNGASIGIAVWTQRNQERTFSFWIAVRPEQRRKGIGTALYTAVLEAIAEYRPLALHTTGREDMPDALSFLHQRGFGEEMRQWGNRLVVADFQEEPFAGIEENLYRDGIAIRTFAEVVDGDSKSDTILRVYEMMNILSKDVPSLDLPTPLPFDLWCRRNIEDPHFLAEGFFIAVDRANGEFIGVSTLSRVPDSDHLQVGLTGVRREYRRRGIALALKVRAIYYARAIGTPVIRTGNATTNAGMLAINERLGFQKQPARIHFVRHIST